ncbi:MAG: DNA adenine methylase [Methylococcales bacterium]
MKIPHPVQYQGSKRNLAAIILEYFPPNIQTVIEPFAGTAAISVATAFQNRANRFLINDLNKPLVNLLRGIIEQPEETANAYEKLWHEQQPDSVGHYFAIREAFNRSGNSQLFLYLLARCAKGAVRYNNSGELNQSPDKRRKGTIPATMRKNIQGVSALLKGKCEFSSSDYKVILKQATKADLVYMDPPYQGVCGDKDSRYYAGINHDEFIESLAELNAQGICYLVSYDGKTGNKNYGEKLPNTLNLTCVEINAGRSSQATLLGRKEITIESLYISPSLTKRLSQNQPKKARQLTVSESCYA